MHDELVKKDDVREMIEGWRPPNLLPHKFYMLRDLLERLPTFPAEGEWKKYPENKPEKSGYYEVTVKLEGRDPFVRMDKWDVIWPCFEMCKASVIAFRELPAPYQEKTNDPS